MCSLYSINNSSKLAGQSSFQVVLYPRGSDSAAHQHQHQHHNTSSTSPSSSWSTSCSHAKRKKMKGGPAPVVALRGKGPVLVLTSQQDTSPVSDSLHYPPLTRIPPAQPYQHPQQRRRQTHLSHGTTHWQQFHQHSRHHSYDASLDLEGLEGLEDHGRESVRAQEHTLRQKRASSSLLSNDQQTSSSYRDAGIRRSSPILNPTDTVQVYSKAFFPPCPPSPSRSTPGSSSHSNSPSLSAQRPSACASISAAASVSVGSLGPTISRPVDTNVISFAAAVSSSATTSSSPRSTLSSIFQSKESSTARARVSNSNTASLQTCMPLSIAEHEHGVQTLKNSHLGVFDDMSSPMGTSVDSNGNDTFDGDEMDLQRTTDSNSSMAEAESAELPLAVHATHLSELDSALKLERKSRLKRKLDRLRAKNATLKSTVTQVKSDLALERQRRSTMDHIYLNIRKELNQKLETEEIKVLNLQAELEQMATEMSELKGRSGSRKASLSVDGEASSMGYRIGYDSSAFSLSSGISSIGGLMLHHHSNLNLISGQDDSEEFLLSHSYSASTVGMGSSITKSSAFDAMSCSDSDHDEDEDEDQHMEDEVKGDDDVIGMAVSVSFAQTPRAAAAAASRRASASSLPTLVEEASDEEQSEDEDSEDSDDERDDSPCTMMEIIMQRQHSRSPEDDVEDPPADANETFETMAQKVLFNAIQSRFTVAQAHLQLDELAVKYDTQLEQTVDVIAKEISRWWEAERIATGGSATGGWGLEAVVANKQTGERISPKMAVEGRVESFFGPLLLQFVASLEDQRMLLDKLGEYARMDARWLKNHSAVLVALYKYDVVEAEAVLEWWQALEEPQEVFGHGGNNLRSLNSKFVAWLEDEEDDSESEDGDSDPDSCHSDDDSEDGEEEEYDGEETQQDDDGVLEDILDLAFPNNSKVATDLESRVCAPSQEGEGGKRRISFCTDNLYYSHDGRGPLRAESSGGGGKQPAGRV